jgi:hypothetical protein
MKVVIPANMKHMILEMIFLATQNEQTEEFTNITKAIAISCDTNINLKSTTRNRKDNPIPTVADMAISTNTLLMPTSFI